MSSGGPKYGSSDASNTAGTTTSSDAELSRQFPVAWHDVRVSIADKRILLGCSGNAEAGGLTAVMGATGSGKTTLLNALSNRSPYTGRVTYGGYSWSKALKRRVSSHTASGSLCITRSNTAGGLRGAGAASTQSINA